MPGLGQFLNRIFFWSYERGTWQYDVAVALILVFVLLTPTRWFRDQPQVGLPVNSTQVELLSKSGELEIYKVDARALAPPERTPALSNDLHSALQKRARPSVTGASQSAKLNRFETPPAPSSHIKSKSATKRPRTQKLWHATG